jgi:hypothetical protein
MKVKEVISLASRMMGDEGGSAWNETDMLYLLKVALHRLFDSRPDLLLSADGLLDPDTEVEALAIDGDMPETVSIRTAAALAHMICHLCYTEDADATANEKLMATHLALFEKDVK